MFRNYPLINLLCENITNSLIQAANESNNYYKKEVTFARIKKYCNQEIMNVLTEIFNGTKPTNYSQNINDVSVPEFIQWYREIDNYTNFVSKFEEDKYYTRPCVKIVKDDGIKYFALDSFCTDSY
eukprot:Pgem_evm14s16871